MNAGRVRHHLYNSIENKKNTFLIVGYCSPNTPGGMLKNGVTSLKLYGERKQVIADIETMDSFSAHADRQEMLQFIENQKKGLKKLFLVHGEKKTQEKFTTFLNKNGFKDVVIPRLGQEIELA